MYLFALLLMYKQILGVKTQTTNIDVLLELGRIPLTLYKL